MLSPAVPVADTLAETWNGTTWSLEPSPDLGADDLGPGAVGGGILLAVSCAASDECVAVGYGGGGVNADGLGYPVLAMVETWDGTAFSLTPNSAPVEGVGVAGAAVLRGISCVPSGSDAACFAGGEVSNQVGSTALMIRTVSAIGALDPTSAALTTTPTLVTASISTSDSQVAPVGSVISAQRLQPRKGATSVSQPRRSKAAAATSNAWR